MQSILFHCQVHATCFGCFIHPSSGVQFLTVSAATGTNHSIVSATYSQRGLQSSAPEDGQNNCPKHVELTGIINKPLIMHLVGCLYYLYFVIFFLDLLNNLNLFLYRMSCIS